MFSTGKRMLLLRLIVCPMQIKNEVSPCYPSNISPSKYSLRLNVSDLCRILIFYVKPNSYKVNAQNYIKTKQITWSYNSINYKITKITQWYKLHKCISHNCTYYNCHWTMYAHYINVHITMVHCTMYANYINVQIIEITNYMKRKQKAIT